MFHADKKVLYTFSSHGGQNAWAFIETLGWKKIKPGNADGVTNLYRMMNSAKANGRLVNLNIDGVDQIDIAYLK